MTNEKSPNHITYFECINCNYKTNNKKDYKKHISTLKQLKNINANKNPQTIKCNCGKIYKHLSSLIKHNKLCIQNSINPNSINGINNVDNLTSIVVDIVKQNQEFKELIIEQNTKMLELMKEKQIVPAIINNNCTNNNFNLNFFLNEQCKDQRFC